MKSEDEIKTCPFCGSDATTISTGNYFPKEYYRIVCKKCCCMQGKLYESVDDAINDWNKRWSE